MQLNLISTPLPQSFHKQTPAQRLSSNRALDVVLFSGKRSLAEVRADGRRALTKIKNLMKPHDEAKAKAEDEITRLTDEYRGLADAIKQAKERGKIEDKIADPAVRAKKKQDREERIRNWYKRRLQIDDRVKVLRKTIANCDEKLRELEGPYRLAFTVGQAGDVGRALNWYDKIPKKYRD